MKNFEKFEKEIKDAMGKYDLCITASNLSNRKLSDPYHVLEWLYEEYKEPLLTNEERTYLKIVIQPFKDKLDTIGFYRNSSNDEHFYICFGYDDEECTLPISKNSGLFKNVEMYKDYTLEELGLK